MYGFDENPLIFMTFQDFPATSGKYEIHPPKLCASLAESLMPLRSAGYLRRGASGARAGASWGARRPESAAARGLPPPALYARIGLRTSWGVVNFDTQISQDILRNRQNPRFSIKFDRFSWKINEKSWILTISKGVVGNLGVEVDHPPKMCAGLSGSVSGGV